MSTRPVHEGLFTDTHLIGGRCAACGRYHFPAAVICPYCGAGEVARVELSETGTLWGWTAVTAAPPGYGGDVPFGFGVVELPEGLRVVTRLADPDDSWTFGQAMHLRIVELGADADGVVVTTWEFAP